MSILFCNLSFSLGLRPYAATLLALIGLGTFFVQTAVASGGDITVSPGNLDFQSVVVGQTKTLPVQIKNNGSVAVHLYRVSSSKNEFDVSGPSLPLSLAPSATVEFKITFRPETAERTSALLEIVTSSQAMISYTLAGSGTAPLAALQLSPPTLNFGSLNLNSRRTKKITLRNTGNTPITISGVTVTGAGFAFSKVSPGLSLAPKQETLLDVSFQPVSGGVAAGKISILSNDLDSEAAVPLAGSGAMHLAAGSSRSARPEVAAASTASSVHPAAVASVTSSTPSAYLTWHASPSSVVGYLVYRGTTSGGPYTVETASPI